MPFEIPRAPRDERLAIEVIVVLGGIVLTVAAAIIWLFP